MSPGQAPPKSFAQYRGVLRILGRYWKAYGGWRAVFASPYAALALAITGISWKSWCAVEWWNTALSVLPNLLGFSLGGYAMLVSFGDEKFRKVLSTTPGNAEGVTIWTGTSATFAHFIVVQALALVTAIVAMATNPIEKGATEGPAWWVQACWGAGFLIFMYALVLTIATAMAIFYLTGWFVEHQSPSSTEHDAAQQPKPGGTDAPAKKAAPPLDVRHDN
ncbi:MAG TPA: hypothetical protein VK550_11180 [Polyangiaceae bacterium]|nr:hypothetical protein [Polyangiaceae bacterium]